MRCGWIALAAPTLCFALEQKPWYPDLLEFNFLARYNYNFFDRVDHGVPQLESTYHTHVLSAGLEVTAPETWNYQLELELADSSTVSFAYRSFAIQVRKLWLDDITCDPVSLSTGLVYRDASTKMRKALSTPYHGRANFELHTSIGREWHKGCFWTFRTYGIVAIGQATSGKPWLRGDLFLWWNAEDVHQFRLYAESYWGLGSRTTVPTIDFTGWGEIAHQSIDLGGSYRYKFGCYGSLQFDYKHRVYAHSYPEHVNFFLFTFKFPFSIF